MWDVRDAEADDFAAMADVYRRSSWSNEGDRALLRAHPEFLELATTAVEPGRSLVAVHGTSIVGFASVDADDDHLELEALFVDPDWMRRGVGTALVQAVFHRARQIERTAVRVDANREAVAFYAAQGFVEIGTTPTANGDVPRLQAEA